jgi:ABC-type multidrug transport system fused ATPase/permease subunit
MSKINNVSNAVDSLIPEILWTHLNAVVSLLVTFIFLLITDIKAALVFLSLFVVLLIVNKYMAPA